MNYHTMTMSDLPTATRDEWLGFVDLCDLLAHNISDPRTGPTDTDAERATDYVFNAGDWRNATFIAAFWHDELSPIRGIGITADQALEQGGEGGVGNEVRQHLVTRTVSYGDVQEWLRGGGIDA